MLEETRRKKASEVPVKECQKLREAAGAHDISSCEGKDSVKLNFRSGISFEN